MYSIAFSDLARKQLKKLEKDINSRIRATLKRIRIRPYPHIKKIAGSPHFSFRVGEYRLILDIDNGNLVILVIELGHRKNIYNKN